MKKFITHSGVTSALAGLVVLGILALGGFFVWQKHDQVLGRLVDLEPRYARMLGLKSSKAELDRAAAEAQALLAKLAYPANQDATQVGNDAQQRLRTLFVAAGLEVVSSQILPTKTEKQIDKVPLMLRLEGQLTGLQSALVVLATQTPTVYVDGLNIQTVGFVKAETPQRLAVQMNLYVLRAHP